MRKMFVPFLMTLILVSTLFVVAQEKSGTIEQPDYSKFTNILGTEDTVITTFPYVESFDGSTFLPNGWTQSSPTNKLWDRVTTGTNPTATPKDGTHMLRYYCYSYTSGSNATLVTPPLTFGAGTYRVKFWMYRDGGYTTYADNVEVLVNDSNDVTTATSLGVINRSMTLAPVVATAGWYEYSFELPAVTKSSTKRIFFKATSKYGNNIFVDKITIEEAMNTVVDWCNLQWPLTHTMVEGNTFTVYAQAWINGVTNLPGATPLLECYIGVNNADTDPATWTNWYPATFNVDAGNNDEFMATIGGNLPAGTYYYASKFIYQGGPAKYGGSGGFWNSASNPSGVLTVTPVTISNYPMTEGFEGDVFPPVGWKVQDLNGGTSWASSTGNPRTGTKHARYIYSGSLPGDDILFTPALEVEAGKTYYVSYYYRAQTSTYPEKMRVVLSTDQSVVGVVDTLADHPNIVNVVYENNVAQFVAPTTGIYYVGFHAYSAADKYYLNLDDIEIGKVFDRDFSVVSLNQLNPIPNPFKESEDTKGVNQETLINPKELTGVVSHESGVYEPRFSSEDNSTNLVTYINGTPFTEGYTPINMQALVKNVGLTALSYTLNTKLNGVSGTPINRPELPVGLVDTVVFNPTATARGTFTTEVNVVANGDTLNTANNSLSFFRTLVYPDPMIRIKYDNGTNTPFTYIGFGTNNLPLTAAVRFVAPDNMRLANVDAFFRNENSTQPITVKVYAAGPDTLTPGTLIYTKTFEGVNYLTSGTVGSYVTLPLGNDAPTFTAGTNFWVGIKFDAAIQFPMGAHNTSPTPGHSFLTANDTLWSPVVISSTTYSWLLRAVGTPWTPPQYTTVWERNKAQNNMPSWFSTANNERGFAFGIQTLPTEEQVKRIYVASRNGGNFVKVLNALTGAYVADLNTTGITGGTLALNDMETSADGKIFTANLTTNASTSAFKVYMWENEAAAPVNIISYTGEAVRLGDKFTVTGSVSDNSAVVWAASATSGFMKVYKFTMSNGTFSNTPTVISLSDNASGTPTSASVGPLPNGDFYWKATGFGVKKYSANGTLLGTIPTTLVASGGNAIRYLGTVGNFEYFVVFQYGAGNENARIMKVDPTDFTTATTYELTPSMGNNSNGNGSGDVAYYLNPDGTGVIYVLSTNNGLGCYQTVSPVPVELTSFVASVNKDVVSLSWTTATETNSKEFVVERKSGSDWVAVGRVNANGTTSEPKAYSFSEKLDLAGKYSYRLKMVDFDGSFSYSNVVEVEVGVPATFSLSQNYPNPFNPSTKINYSIPVDSKVTLELYDITGQKVSTLFSGDVKAGYYNFDFAAGNLASGVYIYRLSASSLTDGKTFVSSKKMMLLK